MSKVDQALERLRQGGIEPLPPVAPAPAGEPQFAAEEPLFASGATSTTAAERPPVPVPVAPESRDLPIAELAADPNRRPLKEKLTLSSHDMASTEQYRRIAARLHLAQTGPGFRVVMVTSAVPGEGKTLTSANLALTLSESYRREVLLVDADLRRPVMHEMLGIPNVNGLNSREAGAQIPLLRLTEHLTVLTAGRPDSNPMSILSSERMQHVLEQARSSFEWVIVDTPPVALLTDAHLLSALVDTVLLVVQAGSTQLSAINTAVNCLGRDKIFGVVLNRADEAQAFGSYDPAYYYSSHGSEQVAAR